MQAPLQRQDERGQGDCACITCAALSTARMLPRGLEPRTLRLLAVRSNQLSYESRWTCLSRAAANPHVIPHVHLP